MSQIMCKAECKLNDVMTYIINCLCKWQKLRKVVLPYVLIDKLSLEN